MAKLGFDYKVDIENTEKQGGGGLLPHMYALIWAEAIELPETKDGKGIQAAITFEVQEPEEFKGRKFWSYWTIQHPDGFQHGAYKYGKPMFDRLCRAVDISEPEDTDDLVFKSFVAEIGIQVGNQKPDGSYYNDKNQIEKFFYSDSDAKEPIPDLGVIGDGEGKKKAPKAAPANDNRRPAANDNRAAEPAKAAGARPWGRK